MKALVLAFVLVAASASAQSRTYLDHRNPPAGVDLNTAKPGDPAPGRPGETLQHDGQGWYYAVAGTPLPTVPTDATCPPAATWNPYTASDAETLACFPRPLLPFVAADGTRYGYVVGEIYGPELYATGERVVVLSVVNDINTPRRVVTVKWLRGPQVGELAVFFEDQHRFVPVRPGER